MTNTEPTQQTPARSRRKVRQGVVISTKMNKTIVVLVERKVRHPLYRKYFKKSKKFIAHDEHETAAPGDLVQIMETRPLSKTKRWRLMEIVTRAR